MAAGKRTARGGAVRRSSESTRSDMFRDAFPDRFIQLGVSEQLSMAPSPVAWPRRKDSVYRQLRHLLPGRNLEQIRMCAAIQNVPIKIVGCHTGVSVGPDGATHQALEDIATMRVLPNMTVVRRVTPSKARRAVEASVEIDGPVYIRLAREATPVFTIIETPFEVGRAEVPRWQ